jgi:eukaryotic-like serine/threonine-protein kinase
MSRVFLARDVALGRDVVVKVLSPELAASLSSERFTREIRLAASLQEPHIVPVLSAGTTTDGLPWFTMPFASGESLRDRLTRGALPTAEALGILREVATRECPGCQAPPPHSAGAPPASPASSATSGTPR